MHQRAIAISGVVIMCINYSNIGSCNNVHQRAIAISGVVIMCINGL